MNIASQHYNKLKLETQFKKEKRRYTVYVNQEMSDVHTDNFKHMVINNTYIAEQKERLMGFTQKQIN